MMVVYFLLGVVFGTVACNIYSGKAIWITLLPFLIVLIDFLNEDLRLAAISRAATGATNPCMPLKNSPN